MRLFFLLPFLTAAAASFLHAQAPAPASLYPFGIDQDNLKGAPDFSYLNHALTPADRVIVRDGHFYTIGPDLAPNTDDDVRIRFYGVNLAFGANFPAGDDAARIAKRLRRLGVNLVRLHHMDSSQDSPNNLTAANGILTTNPYPSFNDVSLSRLRAFLTALAAEGIYADLNLHVGYLFRPTVDQIPTLPNGQAMPDQSKPLHIFHPRMVALQHQFAQQLLRRLNLQNDPVLAMVEINNESSLMQAWQWGQLDPVLNGEYRTALQAKWNTWLAAKYPDTASLIAAWGTGSADSTSVLNNQWQLEQGHGKTGTLTTVQMDGVPTAQVTPGAGSGWLFLKQVGFHVKAGARYVWQFDAKVDAPAGQQINTPTSVMRDVSPWDGFLYSSINLTNQWQTFTIPVTPSFDINDSGRVSLDVEFAPGNVYCRNMKLVLSGERGLAAGETIEAGNISLLGPGEGATATRLADYTQFILATDRDYLNAIRDTVRAETDALVPITGTQVGYGGLTIYDSQDGLDFQDNHFYIDHYAFFGTAWDGFDWAIQDAAAADNVWSPFLDMAWGRQAGKPYTVSEFNQPWPNTHGAELNPSLAAFAAYQDWDAIIHFAYSHGRNWDDGVPNGFNINGDWTKFPVFGQAAFLFRTFALQPGGTRLSIPSTYSQRISAASKSQYPVAWIASQGIPKEAAFTRAVEIVRNDDAAGVAPLPPDAKAGLTGPYTTDTGELTFDSNTKTLVIQSPMANGVFGALGKRTVTAGSIDVQLWPSARGWASVLVTPLDGQPIASSTDLLVSIPGYSLRSQPSPGNRAPSVSTAVAQKLAPYPNHSGYWTSDPTNSAPTGKPSGDMYGGYRPTWMERVEAQLTLRTTNAASTLTVTPLDGAGNPLTPLAASEVQAVDGGHRIHLNGDGQPQSPWFRLTLSNAGAGSTASSAYK